MLAGLREEGLIRHLALSNVDETHLAEAEGIAPVAAIQNLFDPGNPNEVALARRAAEEGIAFVPFGPLGSGSGSTRDDTYAAIARRHHATAAQVALAHVLTLFPTPSPSRGPDR